MWGYDHPVGSIARAERHAAGEFLAEWNGCDDAGRTVASGVCLIVMEAAGLRATGKLALLR
ncbi:MAG: hypothetical protein ABIE42_02310 [Candidatus Eisenbacteria bacterium]